MKLAQLSQPQTETVPMATSSVKYKRKSTDEPEKRQLQSFDIQEKGIQPFIDKPIIRSFQESASAKKPGRKIFNEMMQLVESRDEIDTIFAYDLSRLTRNPIDNGRLQWALKTGVLERIVTTDRTYDKNNCDLLMSIDGGYASHFIHDLSKKVKGGLARRLEAGVLPTLAPLGYQNDRFAPKGSKTITPHPIYFPLVKKVFEKALTGRYSMTALAEIANDFHIKTSRVKPVTKKTIYHTIRNPFYCGKFLYNGILYAGSHKPMLTESQFDRLQTIFDNPSKPRSQTLPALTGVFACGTCGSQITFERHIKRYKNGTSKTFGYYRCVKKNGNCHEKYIPEGELEKQVINVLGNIKISRVYVDWAVKWLHRANEEKEELRKSHFESLTRALNDAEIRISNLFAMKTSPKNTDGAMITDEEYVRERQKLLIEKKKVERQLVELDKTIDEFYDLAEKAFNFAARACDKFRQAKTIDEKKRLLLIVGSNLTISNQKVEIQLQKPFKLIEEALIKLKSREIPLEPKEALLQQSKRQFSSASRIMSG